MKYNFLIFSGSADYRFGGKDSSSCLDFYILPGGPKKVPVISDFFSKTFRHKIEKLPLPLHLIFFNENYICM